MGAFGMRAIKTSVWYHNCKKSHPSAKYDGMPISAIKQEKLLLLIIKNCTKRSFKYFENLGKNVSDSINSGIVSQIYRIIFEEKVLIFSIRKYSN